MVSINSFLVLHYRITLKSHRLKIVLVVGHFYVIFYHQTMYCGI